MFYEPHLIWLHFVSDLLIALAYFSIPIALVTFVRRRRDLGFTWVFWMFAAFIWLCGATHILGVWNLWQPIYKLDGIVKLITGVVSLATAVALWPLIPRALALRSPAQLGAVVEERTAELARMTEERQQALEGERELRAAAEQANRIKDEFLTTLSHELRTPLNAILGWTQILKRRAVDEDQAAALAVIERSTHSQVRLIEDLLDMNRIVTGRLSLDVRPIDLVEVVQAAVDAVTPAAEAKDIRLQTVLDPNVGSMSGDPARLQQVVWNLLTNAVKFTRPGGRVQVFVEPGGGEARIVVRDDGVGIDPAFLPELFQKFRQADSSTTRRHGGLGLGLAIVKHLVEMHGGSVVAESAGAGQGATFTVTLPSKPPVAARPSPAPASSPSVGPADRSVLRGKQVVAIDDEPDTLEVIKVALEAEGMRVHTAESASDGFDLIRRLGPDVILCDIGMPDEDGYSLIRRVRKLKPEEGGDLPVIAVTAFARDEDRAMALRAGFQTHIAKPVDTDVLIDTLSSLLGRPDSRPAGDAV